MTQSTPNDGPVSSPGSGRVPPADPLDARATTPGTPSSDPAAPNAPKEPGKKRLTFKKGPLRDVIVGLVVGGGEVAHEFLARTPAEQIEGVWIIPETDPKQTDAGDFADPLVNIVNRYTGGTMVDANVWDLANLAVAGVVYVGRNLLKTIKLRRAYRKRFGADVPESTDESE